MRVFRSLSTAAAAIGLAWCVVAGWRIWTTPVRFLDEYRSFSDISYFGIVPLVVPVLLAGWATWAAYRQRLLPTALATLSFLFFCFLTGFSIGGAYVPIGIGLVIATLLGILGRVITRKRPAA